MLKSYIKKIVKRELVIQKLNHIYSSKIIYDTNIDSSKELTSHLNEVIHQQNNELSKLYNTISSLKEENLKSKELYSKEKLEKNKLLFNGYGEKYEIDLLKQENEKLKKENEILKQDSEETKIRYNKISEENKQLKESIESLDGKLILKGNLLSESKQENEQLKKELLDSKNGLNGANDIIKNMKQENEKLKNILTEIYEITDSTWGVKLPYFEVRSLLNKIREISVTR